MFIVSGQTYRLVEDHNSGFNESAFKERFSDILEKYDFIVGDWGYNQLRLKGFYDDQNAKATFDTKASTINDYLLEYCNFGCAYFIVQNVTE